MIEIHDPYAQATIENFRRTPPNLRPKLLEILAQELSGSKSAQTAPAASFQRVPVENRAEEFQWLTEKSALYGGEWVALLGNQLLGHSVDYDEVSQIVKDLGVRKAMFMFVDPDESEDFVRFQS